MAFAALAAAAVASAVLAAAASSGTLAARAPAPGDGFAGPVTAHARPLDRDVEADGPGELRQVPCASGDTALACWVAPGKP